MKIVVDENIPFGFEAFSTLGEVELCAGRKIDNNILQNADALVVRSITKVNEELLKNTNVKFVGTATIGKDHIDEEYLSKNGIAFSSAAGCNSYSVTEYVFSALAFLANKYNFDISTMSIGIIGYGNIGTKVAKVAKTLGMKVVINDPPLKRESNNEMFSELNEALSCDIVTFHVPLNKEGTDKTVHLLNEKNINLIKPNSVLINASRGAVVSNEALKSRLQNNNDIHVVLDVWETEPDFDAELLRLVDIGTPHIAGYSHEGKVNGTTMIYNALAEHVGTSKNWKPTLESVADSLIEIDENDEIINVLTKLFRKSYEIIEDDLNLRKSLDLSSDKRGEYFDMLRKTYRKRRELNNFRVVLNSEKKEIKNLIKVLRVGIENKDKK